MSDIPSPRSESCLGLSQTGFHRMAYREWGDRGAERTLVCVHGLTRNGRDFDEIAAAAVVRGWRVVCPDVVGRGDSERLADPAGYGFPQYLQDMTVLLARLGVERVDWLGTSMGGLIGMMMAALPGHPLGRLVMNDVGPFLPSAAMRQIAAYATHEGDWPDYASATAKLRELYDGFGPLAEAQWARLFERSVEQGADGRWYRNYDPAITRAFAEQAPQDVDLWSLWDRLALPVLVLRGGRSELLPAEVAAQMSLRGPQAEVVELPACGHAPALMDPAQIALVLDWLER